MILNSKGGEFLGPLIHHRVKELKSLGHKLFPFDAAQYKIFFVEAGEMLNLDALHPDQTRHGGAGRRPQRQRARPRQCQTAWPLDDRSKSTTVHKNWKDPTDDQQVVSRTSGLLSLVSSQHGARYERFDFPKDAVTSLGWPEVFSMRSMPPKFCLELFAGTARVTKCLLKKGLLPFPIDICIDPRQNVLHVHVGHTLLHLIQGGHIRCLWVGIPCTSLTRARKHDGLGRGPIRSEHHVCGLPI